MTLTPSPRPQICNLAAFIAGQTFGLDGVASSTGCPDVMAARFDGSDPCAGAERSFTDQVLPCGVQDASDCFCPAPPPLGDGIRCGASGECPAGHVCNPVTESCIYDGINPHQRLLELVGPRPCQ